MELKAIEYSRIVFLTSVHRAKGQLFLPFAAGELASRYHFQKIPTGDQLSSDILKFEQGVFGDIGINELSIYPDGIIVSTRADADIIELFLNDLLMWAEADLGVTETGIPPREKHYESAIIVKMQLGRKWNIPFAVETCNFLSKAQTDYGLKEFEFQLGGYSFVVDTTSYPNRKPIPFTLARRIGVSFDADIYYSTAPLRTKHHLELLEKIEKNLS